MVSAVETEANEMLARAFPTAWVDVGHCATTRDVAEAIAAAGASKGWF